MSRLLAVNVRVGFPSRTAFGGRKALFFARFTLEPCCHIYGAPLPERYIATSIEFGGPAVAHQDVTWPEPEMVEFPVLKEILPAAPRFGLLSDPAISDPAGLHAIADTAQALGVDLQTVEVRGPPDFPPAIASLSAKGADGVNVLSSPLLFHFREELGALLVAHKLPAICEWPEMAASACLASYGTTLRELYAAEAALTDKILKGASPADIPAQQPTKFRLVINLRTTKAIGLTIPPSILARADEVIE